MVSPSNRGAREAEVEVAEATAVSSGIGRSHNTTSDERGSLEVEMMVEAYVEVGMMTSSWVVAGETGGGMSPLARVAFRMTRRRGVHPEFEKTEPSSADADSSAIRVALVARAFLGTSFIQNYNLSNLARYHSN
jgi:hypothetical protein